MPFTLRTSFALLPSTLVKKPRGSFYWQPQAQMLSLSAPSENSPQSFHPRR